MPRRRRRPVRRVAATRRAPWRKPADRRLLRANRRHQRHADLQHRRATWHRYHGLGDRRGQRRPFAGRVLWHVRPDPLELSTGALEAAYPFQVASRPHSHATPGIVIGPSLTGGTHTFDPWSLYQAGRLSNPNVLILGDVGSGKSALAKSLVWRGLEFGRGAHIVDPKGEYAALAAAAGTEPIRLHPGGTTVLNPLDPGRAGTQLTPTELFHRNLATLRALLEATLARTCGQLELVLLSAALARTAGLELAGDDHPTVAAHGDTVTLPMLAETLIAPPPDVARRINMDPGRLREESREMALAFARLVDDHGDLGGMFAGPTNVDADALADLTVVDIHAVYRNHRHALPLVMICTAAWLQLATAITPRGRFQLNDEAWALLADDATARWTQTNQKLARALSLSVVNVMHRLSDTAAAGPAGSHTRALADGVIADSGTWIIYRQKPSEQPLLRDTLGLNDIQARVATRLPRGRGLWITNGGRREIALCDHTLSPTEHILVDTDHAMRAADHHTAPDHHPETRP